MKAAGPLVRTYPCYFRAGGATKLATYISHSQPYDRFILRIIVLNGRLTASQTIISSVLLFLT